MSLALIALVSGKLTGRAVYGQHNAGQFENSGQIDRTA